MDAALRLAPPEVGRPGRLVRTLGSVVPGVRRTGEQIEIFAAEWYEHDLLALDSGLPLVVALGDSLAQGIGATSIEHGYVGRLANDFAGQIGIVNLSKSGAKIADVVDRQLEIMAGLGTDPVAVMCTVGSNDLLRNFSLSAPLHAIHRLLDELPDSAIMATLPDAGSIMARRLSRVIRSETTARGMTLADVSAEMQGWRGKTASDGFHPNDKGYDAWVRAFTSALTSRMH